MAREAIELYLEAAGEYGWVIPLEDATPELAAVEVQLPVTTKAVIAS
jgi:hypothetical protein